MSTSPPVSVLIVAAGRGVRAGGGLPKQYRTIGGSSVLQRAVRVFIAHPSINAIQVVINPGDRHIYDAALQVAGSKLLPPVAGGSTRQESVRAGLAALAAHSPGRVLVHDAARPFVDPQTIDRVLAALRTHDGAIAAIPLADTLKRQGPDGRVAGTVDRSGLWRAQTPQGFHFEKLLAAHAHAASAGLAGFTDDAAIAEWAGLVVTIVLGSERNRKLTTEEDIVMADRESRDLDEVPPAHEFRSATGFDVHRFTTGDHVWLCGIRVPHTAALEGHSDADVGLHALTDALLGTIADGDIGHHFPPSDDRWRGAASHIFLAEAARLVAARGGRIVNCDVTLLCEAPRIGPHRDAMRARIAEILSVAIDRVSVRATTTEGLGFSGRREGIAAQAAATVRMPSPN